MNTYDRRSRRAVEFRRPLLPPGAEIGPDLGRRGTRMAGDKPRALDLFCCAGGMSVGLERAGFDVTGVDIRQCRAWEP